MSDTSSSPHTKKLFLMMVLEFLIWGAWLPLIWGYMGKDGLGFTDLQITWVGSAFAIASIVGIFFSNQFADRNFSAEKFLAFSHLVGGMAILALYWVRDFPTFFTLMLIHSLLYVPTISVANSIAFSNLKNAQKEFGIVRMGGTIGWILAAWPFYFILGTKTGTEAILARDSIFLVSGIASLALAAFCLTLPHTPPNKAAAGESSFAWVRSVKFLALPYLLVLFIVTFIDSTIHNGYFLMADGFLRHVGIADKWIMPVMSIGQVAEIVTMAILGLVLVRLGWKTTMILGILGHAARFAVFAFMPESQIMIILVQVLHGICYAFFFATLYIFIDAAFPKDVRSSAQGLFNLLVLGLGDLAAKWLFIPLQGSLTVNGVTDFKTLFLWPTGLALGAAALLFIAFFPPKSLGAPPEDVKH
ncbi:nucleoside transporter [Roseimicrobium gellanilyticum]|uniref:Nucleoside transporter n=1 Tax=Roseimicrobium gellanilyticum TaxID=748857 RepID=A0A366HVB3_9BACT|nr:MFS transporter [Roseimicrobium gellanilyticum]RBP48223.1 nucleoside transporter [Roseimicrobium gellanilyticum]